MIWNTATVFVSECVCVCVRTGRAQTWDCKEERVTHLCSAKKLRFGEERGGKTVRGHSRDFVTSSSLMCERQAGAGASKKRQH